MVADATAEQRAPLERLIAAKWAAVQKTDDVEELLGELSGEEPEETKET